MRMVDPNGFIHTVREWGHPRVALPSITVGKNQLQLHLETVSNGGACLAYGSRQKNLLS
jgi:hypothetical protein